jgi:hypothetical protein
VSNLLSLSLSLSTFLSASIAAVLCVVYLCKHNTVNRDVSNGGFVEYPSFASSSFSFSSSAS